MKITKIILIILVLLLFISACTEQNPSNPPVTAVPHAAMDDDYNPMYFSSEEVLFEAIREVKGKTGKEDDTVIIKPTLKRGNNEEHYSANLDRNKLASITSYYRPSYILDGMTLSEIMVTMGVVSYRYANEDESAFAFFSLVIGTTPEVHMNDLFGRGAMSERILEYNGVEYVFLGWMDTETGKLAGYGVHWVVGEECFIATIDAGYTDEEMLAFCQFEVVVVE